MGADEEVRQRRARRVLTGLLLPSVSVPAIRRGTDVRRGGRNVKFLDAPATDAIRRGSRFRLADADLGETDRIDGGSFGGNRPRNRLPGPVPLLRSALRRVAQHVRIKEHHGSRVIRRSGSHERATFRGDRSIASRHASRLIPGASFARCRRTRMNRSSLWRWTSKMSPGLAPGMTTRLLMSVRTAFMGGNFQLVAASVKWAMGPGGVIGTLCPELGPYGPNVHIWTS